MMILSYFLKPLIFEKPKRSIFNLAASSGSFFANFLGNVVMTSSRTSSNSVLFTEIRKSDSLTQSSLYTGSSIFKVTLFLFYEELNQGPYFESSSLSQISSTSSRSKSIVWIRNWMNLGWSKILSRTRE